MIELIQTVLNVLLLPGLAFTLAASIVLAGLDRKFVARMQRRVGPPVMQPLYDVLKCLGKETIIPRKANEKVFLWAPVVGLASVLVTAMFLPVYERRLRAKSALRQLQRYSLPHGRYRQIQRARRARFYLAV